MIRVLLVVFLVLAVVAVFGVYAGYMELRDRRERRARLDRQQAARRKAINPLYKKEDLTWLYANGVEPQDIELAAKLREGLK